MDHELTTAKEMMCAEKAAIARGLSVETLMERAGQGVVDVICEHFKPCSTLVFCGPGNNGGDAHVVVRILKEKGWPAEVIDFKKLPSFKEIEIKTKSADLIVDGLLGTGLSKLLTGDMYHLVNLINNAQKPVVSIDMPTGIDTDSGAICEAAIHATHTITLQKARPGHYLLPGRIHRGELFIKDIGFTQEDFPSFTHTLNNSTLWNHYITEPQPLDHKYTRGACLIVGTSSMPGAIRLATRAARRIGAGLVRIMCKAEEYHIFATTAWGEIITPIAQAEEFLEWTFNPHFNALLWGTGAFPKEATREQAIVLLSSKKPCVLDGGALSSFEGRTQELTTHLHSNVILTPHEGEFHRLFPHLAFLPIKPEKARIAAQETGSIVVLKGYDTIIANPQGHIVINSNAPSTLATAGTGDVLAGMMVGLLAQGLPPFEAAAAAVWIHAEAANRVGLGLIAEDLSEKVPEILTFLSTIR